MDPAPTPGSANGIESTNNQVVTTFGLRIAGSIIKGPLTCKCLMTSVDVYESLHHKIITC